MIYYIYKVRRKQISIRFSRSALPHRYISWISWNGGQGINPLQAGFPVPCRSLRTRRFSRRCPYPKVAIAAILLPPPRRQNNCPPIFSPRKRKITFFSSPHISHTPFFLRCFTRKLFARHPATHPRPVHRPLSAAFPQTKKCGPAALRREPAHHVCQTCSKKRRLLAQEKHT